MNKWLFICLLVMANVLVYNAFAQQKPELAGKLIDGKLVLTVDLRWNAAQRERFAITYQIDSLTASNVFSKNLSFFNNNPEWTVEVIDNQLIKLIQKHKISDASATLGRFELIHESISGSSSASEAMPMEAVFGRNMFTDEGCFSYYEGEAHFVLKGFEKARKVVLAGSFNDWSSMQHPMKLNGQNWELRLQLPPGKYTYKFIVDGRWLADPANKQKEDDGHNQQNSVVFCPNHLFRLNGHSDAKRVYVSGNFNGWSERSLPMNRKENGWQLPVYLRDGTYTYKFIVDGDWINDPTNPKKRADGHGNENSVLEFGERFRFFVKGLELAKEVKITGSFNDWNPNELFMNKIQGGWEFFYHLAAGIYEYKLIVDGSWMPDPDNPLFVGENEFKNSVLIVKPNHIFRFVAGKNVKEVRLTGSFNGWSHQGYRMLNKGNEWWLPVYLYPGRHTYKFIVDGEWKLDPANPLWEENQFGTGNSVLWVK